MVRRERETLTKQKVKGNYLISVLPADVGLGRNIYIYKVTSELSCGNELFYTLMERRRPKTLQENILQDG